MANAPLKAAKRRAEETEAADFRLLFEAAPAALLVLSPDLTILAATDGLLRATATERANIVGRNVFDVFPDNPAETEATGTTALRCSLERVLVERVPDAMPLVKYDIPIKVDGQVRFEERYWSALNTPVLTPDGRVRCIIARTEDVTEFVRTQARHKEREQIAAELATRAGRLEAELLSERDAIQRFFMVSRDIMCIAGPDGLLRRVNPAFSALGYSSAELLATPYIELVHPDDRERTLATVKALQNGANTMQVENRYRCKDGSYRWLWWTATPDAGGSIYATARDIGENKRCEEALQQATAAAEAATRELESFSYTVAHDLRAPLRSIDGFSQALLEDYHDRLDSEGQEYLQRLRSGAQRMARLIDALLALSQLSRRALSRESVDLSELARTIAERFAQLEPARKVSVTVEPGLRAHADPRLLATVLENLIGNAFKFTCQRANAAIRVGRVELDGAPVFFVRDNGAGFDMAYAQRLFGAFQRLHSAEHFAGTGIGLASAQRVIARHGGRIWADAGVDRGATFFFTLPDLAQDNAKRAAMSPEEEGPSSVALSTR